MLTEQRRRGPHHRPVDRVGQLLPGEAARQPCNDDLFGDLVSVHESSMLHVA
jgi:hypothetical protein